MGMIRASYERHTGTDLDIVNAARVSYDKASQWGCVVPDLHGPEGCLLKKKDANLLRFLGRGMTQGDWDAMLDSMTGLTPGDIEADKEDLAELLERYRHTPIHKSPFNHAFASFHIEAPVFVARQLVKHEYMPWNEISGRYVEFEPEFYEHIYRAKAADKKQGSGAALDLETQEIIQAATREAHAKAYETYKELLQRGVAEEQARGVLPLNLMTKWKWSGTLHAWAAMCRARLRPDAQEETAIVARQIDREMKQLFPVSWRVLVHPLEPIPYAEN